MKPQIIRLLALASLFMLVACASAAPTPPPPTSTPIPTPPASPTSVPPKSASPSATVVKPTNQPIASIPAATISASSPVENKPGEYENSIVIGGETRDYIMHIPPRYDGVKALPLVFVLHGYGGSDKAIEHTTDMSAKADKENFVVVYPNGTGDPRGFNPGFTVETANPADDVAFVRALMDKMEKDLRVDRQRIYIAGFSNGAFMTYRLGAELSDRLAAIAVVEGTIGTKQSDGSVLKIPDPARPLPLIAFHGKQDPTVPYNGGQSDGVMHLTYLSVADSIGFWLKQDGCTGNPETKTSQNGNVAETDHTQCKEGAEVVLYTIGNGKHDWPSPTLPNQISATDATWEFFARHSKP